MAIEIKEPLQEKVCPYEYLRLHASQHPSFLPVPNGVLSCLVSSIAQISTRSPRTRLRSRNLSIGQHLPQSPSFWDQKYKINNVSHLYGTISIHIEDWTLFVFGKRNNRYIVYTSTTVVLPYKSMSAVFTASDLGPHSHGHKENQISWDRRSDDARCFCPGLKHIKLFLQCWCYGRLLLSSSPSNTWNNIITKRRTIVMRWHLTGKNVMRFTYFRSKFYVLWSWYRIQYSV